MTGGVWPRSAAWNTRLSSNVASCGVRSLYLSCSASSTRLLSRPAGLQMHIYNVDKEALLGAVIGSEQGVMLRASMSQKDSNTGEGPHKSRERSINIRCIVAP
jgi:hypothetical protein